MPSRAKPSRRRRESGGDSLEALKPMLVLGLLGMILYGAYIMVQKGKSGSKLEAAPAFAPPEGVAAPAVSVPPVAALAPVATPSPAQAVAASNPEPTYLNAISAPPPAIGDVPTQNAPIVPPPMPQSIPPVAAPVAAGLAASSAIMPPAAVGAAARADATPPAAPALPSATGAVPPNAQPSAFAAAWADAHEKLAAARYAEALAVLSAWYDDPTLGLEESQRLEELVGQLAGTVIYSQEDLLLPPHIVAPGETLQSIAAGVGVPWQLLGKINGIDDPASLLPTEALKMIRGPFDAVVSVSRRRISLQLGGNYAGSFPVVIGRRVQEQVGASLAVADVRRAMADEATGVVAAPVSYPRQAGQPGPAILLANGLRIEAVDDPLAVSDDAPEASLVVSARDLGELVDILGPGSNVLIRQ